MAELLQNSDYIDFTLEQLKTPDGIARLNSIIRKLAQDIPGDGESIKIYKGYGTPEASVTAGISSLYMRLDGGAGTVLYQKQSGTGNTGWVAVPGGGGGFGDVVGPASSTDNAVARFDVTTGKLIQNSVFIVDDSGNTSGVGTLNTHTVPGGTDTFSLLTATQTLTNKRITQRVVTLTDAATVTLNADTTDMGILTTLSQNTTFANPSGTPTNGQKIMLRVKSSVVRNYTWGSQFRGSSDLSLPASTSGSSLTDYLGFIYNSEDTKWDFLAKTYGF